jgi:hypothetical protein
MERLMRKIIVLLMQFLLLSCFLPAQQAAFRAADQYRSWKSVGRIAEFQLSEAQISNIEQSILAYQRESNDYLRERPRRERPFVELMQEDPINEENVLKEIDKLAEVRAGREKASYLATLSIRKNITQEQWLQMIRRSVLRWTEVFKKQFGFHVLFISLCPATHKAPEPTGSKAIWC